MCVPVLLRVRSSILTLDPFRAAVPFGGQTSQILGTLSPKRDCCPERTNEKLVLRGEKLFSHLGYILL